MTHEVNQCRHKRDRQQDAEDLQNGEKLLIEGSPKDCALLVMAGGCGRFLGRSCDQSKAFAVLHGALPA
ncbi:hypothetical protein, partial [uncultured Bifidobacterium sp.]|uniref:hypothetical protein n=1 Tax=uncultured Bifidobacterium sp. TaxID=165187 RepID=UPI002585A529